MNTCLAVLPHDTLPEYQWVFKAVSDKQKCHARKDNSYTFLEAWKQIDMYLVIALDERKVNAKTVIEKV